MKLTLFILILTICIYPALSDNAENDKCLRCHSSETLGYLDRETGEKKSLFVDPAHFKTSNHKDLNCITCHTEGYETWPHTSHKKVDLVCADCHITSNKLSDKIDPAFRHFDIIENNFSQSIHKTSNKIDMDCFSCHNPHKFDIKENVTEDKISTANDYCLKCHSVETNYTKLVGSELPTLEDAHKWLPNPEIHWKNVRCVDCHTEGEDIASIHKILPAEKAVKKCESCHSQNNMLMTKLYKYDKKQSKDSLGFINGIILNDAYIIGSTKNKYLDVISIVFFSLTILGLIIHGSLRKIFKTKNLKNVKGNINNED